MNVAILIAVENYSDRELPSLPFALSDANRLVDAWSQIGFETADQVHLFQDQATKVQIEARIRRTLKGLEQGDRLFLYLACHCLSDAQQSYLACYDSVKTRIANTAISLDWLCNQLQSTDCEQVICFIDPQESRLESNDDSLSSGLQHVEPLRSYFSGSHDRLCYIACAADELSYPSRTLKSSVWSHLLAQAFTGEAPAALNSELELTALSLQHYLEQDLPRVLSRTFTQKKQQSPWALGATDSQLVLADLSRRIAEAEPTDSERSSQARNLSLVAQRTRRLKSLSGFKKEQSKPDRIGSYAQEYVAKASAAEITEDVDQCFGELKQRFKFKRADLHLTNLGDGAATIITPFFNYSITVEPDPNDLSQVIFRRVVDSIKEPDQIFTEPFAAIFGQVFDSVEFQTPSELNLANLIDRIEELDLDQIELEYDPEVTYCRLQIKGVSGTVTLKPDTISIRHDHPQTPALLLRSFFEIQSALANQQEVPIISIGKQRHPRSF